MRGQNVDWISDRFYDPVQDEGHTFEASYVGIDHRMHDHGDDLLAAQADCVKGCYTRADPADIKAGCLPCPNGHASVAW